MFSNINKSEKQSIIYNMLLIIVIDRLGYKNTLNDLLKKIRGLHPGYKIS